MLDWIHQHSQVLNVLLNAGMLAVWLFYAQLLLSSYRHQRRPQVLIAQAKGDDMDAEIMVTNMSEQSVFIEAVIAVVETDDETYSRPVTDASIGNDDESSGESRRVTSPQGGQAVAGGVPVNCNFHGRPPKASLVP